ncbi:response regulator [Paenibacillus nanensis]|uniref:Response regulator n=1 Tax=Paenibacillus nanensis TaxID=393251 RepID=A0A3A1USY3_9BACL|nr:response regulator [Paenibacillus nanensis]RIX46518.1 response regulator [Paenibacillus nanensis]
MYKVLIVDDEYYFRQAIKVSLPWEELDLQLIGEAKNGEDALELTRMLHPDIIMVDINMPIMDGLAFIKEAKAEGFHSKFIVLTGHSEFAYAKHALQLGVSNYVLKPIDEEEIRSSLCEIKNVINKEREAKVELDDLKKQAAEKASLLRNQILNDWLLGNIGSEHLEQHLQSLGMDIVSPYYMTAVIDIEAIDEHARSISQMKTTIGSRCAKFVQQAVNKSFKCEGFLNGKGQFVLIFGSDDNDFGQVGELCDSIRSMMAATNEYTYTIGLGNGYLGYEAVPGSYKEALYALKHRFILGGNRVIPYSKVAQTAMKVSLYSVDKRSRLLMSMRTGNTREVEEWLIDFFNNARLKKASIEMLLVAGLEIFSTCMEFLEETSQDINEIFESQTESDLFQFIEQLNSFNEFEEWIRSLIRKLMSHVHANKSSRSAMIVEEVKTFIESNYANEEMRIEDIARGVHMNYNYLCYVFKKETSCTINDYLTQIRMQRAKELFDQGFLVVQEVASRVGYSDANYFGKCFKKYAGISPSKYISHIGNL